MKTILAIIGGALVLAIALSILGPLEMALCVGPAGRSLCHAGAAR